MQHKVKVTVIDKKLYPELQARYCADPEAGACPCYNVGDEFVFERYGNADDFWHMGLNTLCQTSLSPESRAGIAGGPALPHCSEAWDAIARYIYTGLQGGSIMRNWMNDERVMITCCSDGTRPVIFKIQRLDYKVLYIEGIGCDKCRSKIFKEEFTEVFLEQDVPDDVLKKTVESCGEYRVAKID